MTRRRMLQSKLQDDKAKLGELRRVESERGASAEAVKLIFPPP